MSPTTESTILCRHITAAEKGLNGLKMCICFTKNNKVSFKMLQQIYSDKEELGRFKRKIGLFLYIF